MTDIAVVEERLKGLEKDREDRWLLQRREMDKIWISLEKLHNRPPVWVTWILSVETLIIGLLAGWGLK